MQFSRLPGHFAPASKVASAVLVLAVAACGGVGNRPPVVQPIADMIVVANRPIAAFRVLATDIDSMVLNYTATYQLANLAGMGLPGVAPGLSLNPRTGQVSGSPTNPGIFAATVTVTDGDGASDTRNFNVEVIAESLTTRVTSRQDGAATVTEMVFTAADTGRAGTTAYCIKTGSQAPKADDACFKSAANGGRTLTVPVTAGTKVDRHYLFTVSGGAQILGGTVPTGPFAADTWSSVGTSTLPVIGVQTTDGALAIELENVKAPITTANFLQYLDERFFDATVFHRISSGFVIQGGGYLYDAAATPAYSLKLTGMHDTIALEKTTETGLSNTKGTIAMARSAAADSASSQFFINVSDNAALDAQNAADGNGYAVFGRVISGLNNIESGHSLSTIDTLLATPVQASTILPGENSMPMGTPPSVLYMLRIN